MKRNWMISRWLKKFFSSAKPVPKRRRKTARLGLERLEERWLPSALFTVTDNGDTGLATQLRAAIIASNNPATGATPSAPNTIGFNIGGGAQTITILQGVLPTLTEPVIINGFSETAGSTTPQIEAQRQQRRLRRADLWGQQRRQRGAGTGYRQFQWERRCHQRLSSVTLVGNYIGTDVTGATALTNGGDGVLINNGAAANTIGGTASGAGNVISGNMHYGVYLTNGGTSGNVVLGNLIGTDLHGTASLANNGGVEIASGATANTIGGAAAGARNVISGNQDYGVYLNNGGTSGNVVLGNFIGTDVAGTAALGNHHDGVDVNGAPGNTIGGTASGAGNLLSGNGRAGLYLRNPGAAGNVVLGNLIGTDAQGTAKLGNGNGVEIRLGAVANTIGGTVSGAGNVISGNAGYGVGLQDTPTSRNVVLGNLIGADKFGTAGLGNGTGVQIWQGATANTIGGTASGAGNIISGNTGYGVDLFNGLTSGNVVLGNFIGTDITGTAALSNRGGVDISGPFDNTIGGAATGAGNVISGNNSIGVYLHGASLNVVLGNFIGTDVNGTAALGNSIGVSIAANATANTIGGAVSGARNLISGNGANGVYVTGTRTSGNVVLGNLIGTDVNGTAALGNTTDGILLTNHASSNTIGGTASGAANLISGYGANGVYVTGTGTSGNVVLGNLIGTDVHGTAKLGNIDSGVAIEQSATANTIGGSASGAANVISANGIGVFLAGIGTSGNVVLGNLIGTDSNGTAKLGNANDGVLIQSSATANTVGGTATGSANVISGNSSNGVNISISSANVVLGNLIGADVTGTAMLGNGGDGVFLAGNSVANTVGGTAAGSGNVISGNGQDGVFIDALRSSANIVLGNFIGADVHGTASLGNTKAGVVIIGAAANTIGGTASGAGNVISGNNSVGVMLKGAASNVVLGNLIGTDVNGTAALGNTVDGVTIAFAQFNTIGGTASGARNVISGNARDGVYIYGSLGLDNVVLGNLIGTDVNGTAALGNGSDGVQFNNDAAANTIGGTAIGAGNVISANPVGIELAGSITANIVVGNLIGTSINGSAALGNTIGLLIDSSANNITASTAAGQNTIEANQVAIELNTTASGNEVLGLTIGTNAAGTAALPLPNTTGLLILGASNTVGGVSSGSSNVISGNAGTGLVIQGSSATGNVVLGNFIGTDVNGTTALGNSFDGILIDPANGNTIGPGNVISGNATNGLQISGVGASANLVIGNYIGTDVNGTAQLANGNDGVLIDTGASVNTVGGTATGAGNVISGNGADGVSLNGVSGSVVLGNLIGTDVNGTTALGNRVGIRISNGATANTVGGTASGSRNVISGNVNYNGGTGIGVYLIGAGASGNVVLGNLIGTDVHGTAALGNSAEGVVIEGATANTIGGTASGTRNVISANYLGLVVASGASGNVVLGNFIGTDVHGTAALGNFRDGVSIQGATANTIGGSVSGSRNVISDNARGIYFLQGSLNVVLGNFIGTDVNGTAALGNSSGVELKSGSANTVGGATSGSGNLISGNDQDGVQFFGEKTLSVNNVVLGNFIGTDVNGTAKLGNTGDGVNFSSSLAAANTIGGTVAGSGNVISGNGRDGVYISGAHDSGNVVLGNFIGTDKNGTASLSNSSDGVLLANSTMLNTIGGSASGAANVISGNGTNGVEINGVGSSANLVEGNLIGTDVNGTAKLGNTNDGVLIDSGATANSIDPVVVTTAANVISGNGANGVEITGVGTSANLVFGNLIGADKNGTATLGNSNDGVSINSGATANTVGGTAAGAGNVISGNGGGGVYLYGSVTSGNVVLGNLIGTDKNGTANLGNSGDGVDIEGGASANTVGGAVSGAANIISGNGGYGVYVSYNGTSANVVLGTSSART